MKTTLTFNHRSKFLGACYGQGKYNRKSPLTQALNGSSIADLIRAKYCSLSIKLIVNGHISNFLGTDKALRHPELLTPK